MIDYSIRRQHSVFKDPKPKPMDIPPDAVQIASLSAITTIIVTITYMILYIIYLICRFKQSTDLEDLKGSNYFVYVLREVYIKDEHSINGLPAYLTKSFTVYKFVLISLSMSIVSLICAAGLLWTTFDKKQSHYFINMAYLGVIPFTCCLAVDTILAFSFGWDYGNLSHVLDRRFAGVNENYTIDTIRLVALFLMTLALKGYVLYLIQATFLAILVVKVYQMDTVMEHPMNRMSILKAYEDGPDKEKREAERQQRELNYFRGLKKTRYYDKTGQAVTQFDTSRHGAIDDEISNYSSSYEPVVSKQSIPVDVQWHRDDVPSTSRARSPMAIELVPIPAPDYSPEPARRLKPALKSTYQT